MAQNALILVDRGKESSGLAATGHQRHPHPFTAPQELNSYLAPMEPQKLRKDVPPRHIDR
ncbi:MAG: hypothetical protein SOW44_06370 [Porphyromonas sp.]|nr:hypothetical protein [Porphyromonas sp.]